MNILGSLFHRLNSISALHCADRLHTFAVVPLHFKVPNSTMYMYFWLKKHKQVLSIICCMS